MNGKVELMTAQGEQVPAGEQIPKDVSITLTPRQARELGELYLARSQADREFTLYAAALLAGTPYGQAVLIGLEPQQNGTPPRLIVRV